MFDGFTYFRNALAGSDGTVVSVPNMLTAANYDNSVPYLEFVRSSFLERSLPKTLTEYGFRVDLLPIFNHSVYTDFSGTPPTGKRLRDWPAFFEEQALVADLAVFRSVPHFAKELVYNRQRWLVSGLVKRFFDVKTADGASGGGEPVSAASSGTKYARELANSKALIGRNRDARFIDEMIAEAGILGRTDAFKFIHLSGIHPALVVNENLDYEVMDRTRANMVRQGTGILKIAALFLERLDRLGVYDNSLVFIVGDHGSGLADAGINVSPLTATFNTRGPYTGNFKTFKAAGIPLILAKRMNARGALKTSDAPVALSDIPLTVVEELGLEAEFPGRSMFGVREDEERERIYRAFVGPQEDIVYLAPLYEYAVNGHSWDDASWRETGNVYIAPK